MVYKWPDIWIPGGSQLGLGHRLLGGSCTHKGVTSQLTIRKRFREIPSDILSKCNIWILISRTQEEINFHPIECFSRPGNLRNLRPLKTSWMWKVTLLSLVYGWLSKIVFFFFFNISHLIRNNVVYWQKDIGTSYIEVLVLCINKISERGLYGTLRMKWRSVYPRLRSRSGAPLLFYLTYNSSYPPSNG